MKDFETIKTLADFKRFCALNIGNANILLSSKIVKNGTNEVIRENPPAPIAHVQTNQFALNRKGNLSWMEFGKAANWTFYGSDVAEIKARHNVMPNNPNYQHIIFTIHKY